MNENNTNVEEISTEVAETSAEDIEEITVETVPDTGEDSTEDSLEGATDISETVEEETTEEEITEEETTEEETTDSVSENNVATIADSDNEGTQIETYTEVPFLEKPLDDYTVSEGLLLLILVFLLGAFFCRILTE